jgi:hypothetical protein
MGKLSDFRQLVYDCVLPEWQTLDTIAKVVWETSAIEGRKPFDREYHRRVANALWSWYAADLVEVSNPTESIYKRDLEWRRTQEASHE